MNHFLSMALVASVLTGCVIDEPADSGVDSRVTVLSQVPGSEMTVLADKLEFPRAGNDALLDLAAGDLVVSASGAGFLRSVVAVTANRDRIVIATTDAELSDALIEGDVKGSFGGEGKADTHQLSSIGFSITDRTVVNNAKMTVKVNRASISLQPEIDLDVQIRDRHLSAFEMVVRGRLTGSIDLAIDARDIALGPEIPLWESPPAFFYQQIGVLPVVETVTTSVSLKLQVVARGQGSVRMNGTASAKIQSGIRYTVADGWDGVADLDLQADGGVPVASATFAELGIRAWLIARADVKFYGVAGPYIEVGPQIEVVRDLVEGDFDGAAGFKGEIGGELKIGGINLLKPMPKLDLFDTLTPVF